MSDFSDNNAFVKDDELYGKNIETIPNPQKNIGIDTDDTLLWDLASIQGSQSVDIGELEKFTTLAGDRNQLYSLIDSWRIKSA